MKNMEVNISHGLHPELAPYLLRAKTVAKLEINGSKIVFNDIDFDCIQADVQAVGMVKEQIDRIQKRTGYFWITKEVLDGRAILVDDKLFYPKPSIRDRIEFHLGFKMPDSMFKEIMDIVTDDIKANMIAFRKPVTIDKVIEIAAQALATLKRCGMKKHFQFHYTEKNSGGQIL